MCQTLFLVPYVYLIYILILATHSFMHLFTSPLYVQPLIGAGDELRKAHWGPHRAHCTTGETGTEAGSMRNRCGWHWSAAGQFVQGRCQSCREEDCTENHGKGPATNPQRAGHGWKDRIMQDLYQDISESEGATGVNWAVPTNCTSQLRASGAPELLQGVAYHMHMECLYWMCMAYVCTIFQRNEDGIMILHIYIKWIVKSISNGSFSSINRFP